MATGVTIYQSTDGSAPQLYGQVGGLITVLDACLINGYGAKAAAGWSTPYTGTNKKVYRPPTGANQFYMRINDNGAGTGGAKEALIRSFETMSAVDTGTGGMPHSSQSTLTENSLVIRKSTTADGTTARPWLVAADDRTILMFIKSGDNANCYEAFYWGDFFSSLASDGYRTFLSARTAENSGASAYDNLPILATSFANLGGNFIQRAYTGTGNSITVAKTITPGQAGSVTSFGTSGIKFPNPEDSGLYMVPPYLIDCTVNPPLNYRGKLRGLWNGLHHYSAVNDGDIFSGVDDLAGRTFLILKATPNGIGYYIVETSDTWDTSS